MASSKDKADAGDITKGLASQTALVASADTNIPPELAEYRLFDAKAMAIFRENLGDEPIDVNDLPKIKVPAGGATVWAVPTATGEDEPVKELRGIIVASRNTRAYWPGEYSGSKDRPDCSSHDGISGFGIPGGSCLTCPMAQWGSDPKGGDSQACKKVQMIFVMLPGNNLPYVIPVPPGSLASVKKYFLALSNINVRYSEVISSFKLIKQVNKAGIPFSQIVPSLVTQIPTEFRDPVNDFVKEHAASFSRVKISREMM